MKHSTRTLGLAGMAAATFLSAGTLAASNPKAGGKLPTAMSSDPESIRQMTADWPERPRLAVSTMMAKYGGPKEITSDRIVWHQAGPFKRIMVTREEIPHDFPKPHMDFLEHTIHYNVPSDKVDELIAFDGSSTINRTAGELSARCDLEGHNILTLNLDHDIVTGTKSVEQARKAFGDIVVQDVLGNHPAYVEALQFKPSDMSARFADVPVIPGSPKRSMNEEVFSDAEILAYLIAMDENEVLAAAEAHKKDLRPEVADFAKRLHKTHGMGVTKTMKLGQKLELIPADTKAVDRLRKKGAGELAALVPLTGERFGGAYLEAMIKGHGEALQVIDNQLLKNADQAELKAHLTEARNHVSAHLEEAKRMEQTRRSSR